MLPIFAMQDVTVIVIIINGFQINSAFYETQTNNLVKRLDFSLILVIRMPKLMVNQLRSA